jgi:sugar phosphate permease
LLRRAAESKESETKKSATKWALSSLVRIPAYLLLAATGSAMVLVLWFLYTWMPNYFYEKFSLSLSEAGFQSTFHLQSGTIIGLLCGGVVADWLYRRTPAARFWLVAAGILGSAPCLFLLAATASLTLAEAAAQGLGLCAGIFIANFAAAAFDVVPSDTRASAMGFLNLVGTSISGFGAYVGGAWKQSVGIETLMQYGAALSLLAGLLLILTIKTSFQRAYDDVH